MASRGRRLASEIDMYRKVPADLMEGTRRGSILSYIAVVTMVSLFVMETKAYFESRLVADLKLDQNDDPRVRLNFNITMMDLKCDFCVVDVVSALGTDQNVTSHVTKWQIDSEGVRQRYQGRNKQQKDITLFDSSVTNTLEELHENGEDAISLDAQTLEFARKEQEYLFVDFYAPWCSHCRQLAPTWETLAEVMSDAADNIVRDSDHLPEDYTLEDFNAARQVELPVMVAKVDCVTHQKLCNFEQSIRAYPTLRLFVDGEPWKGGDYHGHRTIIEMVEWLHHVEVQHKEDMGANEDEMKVHVAHEAARKRLAEGGGDVSEEERQWNDKMMRQKRRLHYSWIDEEHPGCQLSGHLLLNRVPGNFHIQARSAHHDLAAHMTNVSHVVHSLYFGDPMAQKRIQDGKANVPPGTMEKVNPMDGNVYVTYNLHEAYHHYLKVISTNVDGLTVGRRNLRVYQVLENSQLAYYRNDVVPEAKFIYDLSPISVSYRPTSRHWYDYITSLMAIIGGTFTVVGMLESGIYAMMTTIRRRRKF